MATITQQPDSHAVEASHRTTTQILVVVGLIAWAIIGPILFVYYGNHVNNVLMGGLDSPAAEASKAAYYAHAMAMNIYGAAAWVAGLIVLAILALPARAQR